MSPTPHDNTVSGEAIRKGGVKPTPGPWFVYDGGVCAVEYPADGGNVICLEPERIMAASLARWPANARLLAASPDLLQATLALYGLLVTDPRYEGSECLELAHEAIAKAVQS